jgi:hypothetical protein
MALSLQLLQTHKNYKTIIVFDFVGIAFIIVTKIVLGDWCCMSVEQTAKN